MNWVDDLVSSVGTERCKVFTLSGVHDWGNFANLTDQQFLKVLSKLSKLQQWTADIINHNYSCGALLAITGGGIGGVSQQGIFLGPFQT